MEGGAQRKKNCIKYTGRTITCRGSEIHVGLQDWIESPNNMRQFPVKKILGRNNDDPLSKEEHGDFRSGVCRVHWCTSQVRVDHAVDTSRLQKSQNSPTVGDLKDLSKVIKEIRDTSDTVLRVVPILNPV